MGVELARQLVEIEGDAVRLVGLRGGLCLPPQPDGLELPAVSRERGVGPRRGAQRRQRGGLLDADRGPDVHGHGDLLGVPAGGTGALANPLDGEPDALRRAPVEEDAVGDLPGEARHAGAKRGQHHRHGGESQRVVWRDAIEKRSKTANGGDCRGKAGDEIVAVGDNGTIIHYNGSAWSLLPQSASGENLRAVHAAPGGGFGAAGWNGTVLRRTASGEWAVGTTSPLLFDAAGFAGQLYAVGEGGVVVRDAGTGWNPLPVPAKRPLFAVTEDQGTLLAVGDAGTIVRYDGTGWQDESYLARWLLRSIWIAPGTGDGFIVGDRGLILRRAGPGGRWVEDLPPVERFLRHVWGLSPSRVYAVGDSGTVLTWSGGSSWKLVPTPTDSILRSVWGSGPQDLFAVGTGGTIVRYDGVRWYSMASPTTKDLRSVWGKGPTEVYAAGEDGVLLQFDGARWTAMSSPTDALLLSIAANAQGEPVIVGARGIRLEAAR